MGWLGCFGGGEKAAPEGYWDDFGPPPGSAGGHSGGVGMGANKGESGKMPAHVLAAAKAAEERVKQQILANQAKRDGAPRKKLKQRSARSPR